MTEKVIIPKYDFSSGEWSANSRGNKWSKFYHKSCSYVKNFIPSLLGNIRKRQGLAFAHECDASTYRIETINIGGTNYLVEFTFTGTPSKTENTLYTIIGVDKNTCKKIILFNNGDTITQRSIYDLGFSNYSYKLIRIYNYLYNIIGVGSLLEQYNLDNSGNIIKEVEYSFHTGEFVVNDLPTNIRILNVNSNISFMFWIPEIPPTGINRNIYFVKFSREGIKTFTQSSFIYGQPNWNDQFSMMVIINTSMYLFNEYIQANKLWVSGEGWSINNDGFGAYIPNSNNNLQIGGNVPKIGYNAVAQIDSKYIVMYKLVFNTTNTIATYIIINITARPFSISNKTLPTTPSAYTYSSIHTNVGNNYHYAVGKSGANYGILVLKFNTTTIAFEVTQFVAVTGINNISDLAIDNTSDELIACCNTATGILIKKWDINITDGTLSNLYNAPEYATTTDKGWKLAFSNYSQNINKVKVYNSDNNVLVSEVFIKDKIADVVVNQNAMYLLYDNFNPQILYQDLDTNLFAISELPNSLNGPWDDKNQVKGKTIEVIRGTEGVYNLNSANFQIGNDLFIGDLIRLYLDPDIKEQHAKQWQAAEDLGATPPENTFRWNNFNNYKFVSFDTGTKTGNIPPTHTEGIQSDGGAKWAYHDSEYCHFIVTDITSPTSVACQLLLPDDTPLGLPYDAVKFITYRWQYSAWVDKKPNIGTIFQSRLALMNRDDNNLYFSNIADPLDFNDLYFGQVQDDNAFTLNVISQQGTQTNGIVATQSGLLLLSNRGERLVYEADISHPFSPTNAKVTDYKNLYSSYVKPIKSKDDVVFVQDTGRNLISISTLENQGYLDLNYYSYYLCSGKYTGKLAYMREQYTIIISLDNNGNCYFTLYDRSNIASDEPIFGNARCEIYNGFNFKDVVVDQRNVAHFLIQRGNIRSIYTFGDFNKVYCFDLAHHYALFTPVTSVTIPQFSGINELFIKSSTSTTVFQVSADSNGLINLPTQEVWTNFIIGTRIDAEVQTEEMEVISDLDSSLGKIKKVSRISIDTIDTTDLSFRILDNYLPSSPLIEFTKEPLTGYSYSIIHKEGSKTIQSVNDSNRLTKVIQFISNNHGYCEINRVVSYITISPLP